MDHLLWQVKQQRPQKEQTDSLLGCWSMFHAAGEYKAAVSTQLTPSSVLRLADHQGGEGRFLFPAQSVFQCAPADCLCSGTQNTVLMRFP